MHTKTKFCSNLQSCCYATVRRHFRRLPNHPYCSACCETDSIICGCCPQWPEYPRLSGSVAARTSRKVVDLWMASTLALVMSAKARTKRSRGTASLLLLAYSSRSYLGGPCVQMCIHMCVRACADMWACRWWVLSTCSSCSWRTPRSPSREPRFSPAAPSPASWSPALGGSRGSHPEVPTRTLGPGGAPPLSPRCCPLSRAVGSPPQRRLAPRTARGARAHLWRRQLRRQQCRQGQ